MVRGKRRFSQVMGISKAQKQGKHWPVWLMLRNVDEAEILEMLTDEYIRKERAALEPNPKSPRSRHRNLRKTIVKQPNQLQLPVLG